MRSISSSGMPAPGLRAIFRTWRLQVPREKRAEKGTFRVWQRLQRRSASAKDSCRSGLLVGRLDDRAPEAVCPSIRPPVLEKCKCEPVQPKFMHICA